MDANIVLELMYISMGASIIATQIIQKIKETISLGKTFNKIMSIIVSCGIGFTYSYSFCQTNILYSIWVSLFTLIGSENMYKTYKERYNIKINTEEK